MNESPFNSKLDMKKHRYDMILLVILTILGLCVFGAIIWKAVSNG